MSDDGTGAPVATSAAAEAVEKVEAAAEADPSTVSTTASPISKWPWGATLLIALALLFALFVFQWLLWSFVSNTKETPEKEDFDQLKAIADNVQTVVVLLVGAIFGVGATQGLAAGAAKAADDNKAAAEKANDIANKNATASATNQDRAETLETVATNLARAITDYRRGKRNDDSRYLPNVRAIGRLQGAVPLEDLHFQEYDRELDRMAADAERVLRKLGKS